MQVCGYLRFLNVINSCKSDLVKYYKSPNFGLRQNFGNLEYMTMVKIRKGEK